MRTIYKYELDTVGNIQVIELPLYSQLLDIQNQSGKICLWFMVDTDREKNKRCFKVYGTGDDISELFEWDWKYIGTVQIYDFVWHIMEVDFP